MFAVRAFWAEDVAQFVAGERVGARMLGFQFSAVMRAELFISAERLPLARSRCPG
jgi:hypothetical protein